MLDRVTIAAKDIQRGIYAVRSPRWPGTRRRWLDKHPTCAACGSKLGLEVHHILPFHLFPALELSPENFITLCEVEGECEHHLGVGHTVKSESSWKIYNPHVSKDAELMLKKKL